MKEPKIVVKEGKFAYWTGLVLILMFIGLFGMVILLEDWTRKDIIFIGALFLPIISIGCCCMYISKVRGLFIYSDDSIKYVKGLKNTIEFSIRDIAKVEKEIFESKGKYGYRYRTEYLSVLGKKVKN